jgi:hypothetical protein
MLNGEESEIYSLVSRYISEKAKNREQ